MPMMVLDHLSSLSTMIIGAACAVHMFSFFILWVWCNRDMKRIASILDHFTRGLNHRSVLDSTSHISDQIEAFLADVNEVLADPKRTEDRTALLNRMNVIDEKRGYLNSLFFETAYNIARTMIEAYPLAGVLGTILAIGAALQVGQADSSLSAVNEIVSRFGDAIWSTFAGLTSAIVLMFANSILEPPFQRLSEHRRNVRDTIAHAKRELTFDTGATK